MICEKCGSPQSLGQINKNGRTKRALCVQCIMDEDEERELAAAKIKIMQVGILDDRCEKAERELAAAKAEIERLNEYIKDDTILGTHFDRNVELKLENESIKAERDEAVELLRKMLVWNDLGVDFIQRAPRGYTDAIRAFLARLEVEP